MWLVDAHIHVDHMEDPVAFARKAMQDEMGLFSNTVTPEGFLAARQMLQGFEGIRVGLGLHPWWIQQEGWEAQRDALLAQLPGWSYVGEVGLDFSAKREATRCQQTAVLQSVLEACAAEGGKVISLHCVQAYDCLLEMLESTGAAKTCRCLIHWFSGTHDDLLRAIALGCWFSVGERLLSSKKGRAYVKDMPLERLLLETDAPPLANGLESTYDKLAEVLGSAAALQTGSNGCRLLKFEE